MDNAIINVDKINKLMNTFLEIMETMNEKNQFFIKFYPDKAREVMRRLGFTPNIGASQLTIKKRLGYTIIQNKGTIVDKGKKIMASIGADLEERPLEPSSKRRKITREEGPHFEGYSPSGTTIRIEEEQLID